MFKDLPDEDAQLEHLLAIDREMRARGFEHYEISNFAKPGRRAQHNLEYWQGGSYLGLGPSAHSFDSQTSRRWKNVSSLHKYAELLAERASPIEWTEELNEEQKRLERWMLALRLEEGFPEDWLASPLQRARARKLAEERLLEPHPALAGRLRLTARGFALSDQIISTLAVLS
jgi:oxygen-independent coproporphyrinogen-3 oxidase